MIFLIVTKIHYSDEKGERRCLNMYDIRSKEEPSPECGLSWPYELSDVTNYLRVRLYSFLSVTLINRNQSATPSQKSCSCRKTNFRLERMYFTCVN